jgi:outer membrane protein OmpA-like peptidoglycan-associated protein
MKKALLPFLFLSATAFSQVDFSFSDVELLSNSINSKFEETAPVYDAKNDILYFTRSLHVDNIGGPQAGQDVWYSKFENGSWSVSENNLPTLNNKLNNSVIGVSADGEVLYLLSTYARKVSLQDGFSSAQFNGEIWEHPEKLDISGLNFKGDFYSGFVNEMGDILIISMDDKNSLGQEDLYISILEDGKWSKPEWLGDSLNSAGYEISPYLFPDNKTLVFASNGHGGLGDCDIFYAYRKDSTWTNWTKPINMGAPINSTGFDAYAYPANDVLFFSSNRVDSLSNIFQAQNESYYKEADTVRLSFRMHKTSLSRVKVDVFDMAGTAMGRYSSANGNVVNIPGLRQKQEYQFIASHEDVNVALFTPYVLNVKKEPISEIEIDKNGEMRITPESKEANNKSPRLPDPVYVKGMSGIFELDGVPVRDVMLSLVDKDGFPTQYAQTDAEGRFEFADTPDSAELFVEVISDLQYIKKNGELFFTDNNGDKLIKAETDESGVYTYQKLKASEMAQLQQMKEMDANNLVETGGVFRYKNLPREGVKLYLLDENDNIIEEVTTDANGEFKFKKLRPDGNFQIRVSEEEDSEFNSDGFVYMLDAQGNEVGALESETNGGGFTYRALSSQLANSLRKFEEEDAGMSLQRNVFSVGLFKYKSLPAEGTILRLIDENDMVIETATTDANGHFVFSMLEPDRSYRIEVVGADEVYLKETEMYFVSKEGKVVTAKNAPGSPTYTFSKLSSDYFFNVNQINERETQLQITESFKDFKGQFKYQTLPKAGVKLYLYDENDKIIDTVYTDEEGNFVFSKLARESNYFVRLAEEDMSLLDGASFTLVDEEGKEIVQEEVNEDGGFSFKTLPRSSQAALLAQDEASDGSLDASRFLNSNKQVKMGTPSESAKTQTAGQTLKLNTTYFHFNSVRLSDRDRYKMNREVIKEILKTRQPILVVGYSCDLGSPEEREAFARLRAETTKAYLINAGLTADLIEIGTVIDSLDGTPNPTSDQRVQSRKVEIIHLIP